MNDDDTLRDDEDFDGEVLKKRDPLMDEGETDAEEGIGDSDDSEESEEDEEDY